MNRLLCLLYVGLIIPFAAAAGTTGERAPHLSLEKKGGNLTVLIENDTEGDVKINKEFSMDPLVGSIHFIVKVNNKAMDMAAQINPVPISENSYIKLQPGEIYGHVFETLYLEKIFNVKGACYTIEAYYQDKESHEFSSYGEKMTSNKITVCNDK